MQSRMQVCFKRPFYITSYTGLMCTHEECEPQTMNFPFNGNKSFKQACEIVFKVGCFKLYKQHVALQ